MPAWITSLIASLKPIMDFLNKLLGLIFPNPSATKKEQDNIEAAQKENKDLKNGGRPE